MANNDSWILREEDKEFYRRELDGFLPDRIYDAHAHLWNEDSGLSGALPSMADIPLYRKLIREMLDGRGDGALFMPFPTIDGNTDILNDRLDKQLHSVLDTNSNNRALALVRPGDDPERLAQRVHDLGGCGLKCYHCFAKEKDSQGGTWQLSLPAYLPEPIMEVANDQGWVVTLHIVRHRAMADEDNISRVRHYCQTYPNATIILAHSARGFQPSWNLEGLQQLTGLPNLYFDCSANCEPIAHQAVLRIIGHDKLLYGSDFPVSHLRGRSVAAADSFLWLYEDSPVWNAKHDTLKPVFVGLEQLRSLKWACWAEKLSDKQIEDIFWGNAARLFELHAPAETMHT